MPGSNVSEALIAAKIERNDLVIALGGGVVGDLAGFAAAILRRGVDFVQVPTSLLAQVDSSVGGKTGINSPQGKNLVGAFHQPILVLADTAVLDTLSPRQFRAGYAEVAKYGLLGDEAFFAWLEKNQADSLRRCWRASTRSPPLPRQGRDRRPRRTRDRRARAAQSRPHLRPRAGSRDRFLRPPVPWRRRRRRHGAGRGIFRAARHDFRRGRRAHKTSSRFGRPADAWLRAVEGGAVYETEYRTRTRDGAWRWYAVRGVPVRDAGGTAREWVGVCIDIDERKRAEAELRESEERYRTLVDTAPDAVFVHQDRTVVLANREAVALFGAAEAAELVGRPVEDLIDPDSLPLALERIARLTEPGQRNELAEMRYRRLDGSPFPVEVASAAVPVGGRLAVQVAFRDIGARKAAEAHQHLLVQELAHRVKNTLAVVQGIAARSLADGRPLAEARDVLMRRLRALASAHTLLLESGWRGASLRALAGTLLAPYGQQVAVSGPDVTLTPRAALTLSMVLHELATNAAKHGALSAPEGRVAVGWEVAGPPGATSLSLSWRETGGPPVALPARRGFGRVLIEQAVAHELGGRARLEFGPQGVSYALEADLASAA